METSDDESSSQIDSQWEFVVNQYRLTDTDCTSPLYTSPYKLPFCVPIKHLSHFITIRCNIVAYLFLQEIMYTKPISGDYVHHYLFIRN